MSKFMVRPKGEADKNFIFVSWNKGLRYSSKHLEIIPLEEYNIRFQKVFDELWKNNGVTFKVAVLPDAQDVILGYVIHQGTVLHWVFTKDAWRKMGIAKLLVPSDIKTCTNLSPPGKFLAKKYGIEFIPFL